MNGFDFGRIKLEWLSFVSALGLMSRIPISLLIAGSSLDADHHHRSQIWYPWVGALLGLFLLVWLLMAPGNWSPLALAAVGIVVWVSFTGALHLDGLADSADAWVGGMAGDAKDSAEKTLCIMKDPTSGPMAIVVLILVLMLKVVFLAEILESIQGSALIFLMFIPMLARAWLLPLLYKTPYARQSGGMANDIASEFPFVAAAISFLICQILIMGILWLSDWGWMTWAALNLFAFAVFTLIRTACLRRIGGYTGDILGAFIELQELTLLFVLALLVSY